METKYYKRGELKDELIIADLKKAAVLYEDGAIIETRDLLQEIICAINEFDDGVEGR